MDLAKGQLVVRANNCKFARLHCLGNQAAAGEQVDETNVTFLDVQTMLNTLSPRRLDLLRHVRQHGASNVRELALALARDYKNVHQDVAVLEANGLLIRDGRKLSAPWDELQAHVSLL